MKFNFQTGFLLILLSVFTFACTDDITDMGSHVRPSGDSIQVQTDTFHLNTDNVFVDSIVCRPDSFLLGTFYDEKYGTTYADILAQVQPPLDFSFPPGSVADSAVVVLYYDSWFGDKYSPMEVNIYEMNKSTFRYTSEYNSGLSVIDYCDQSIPLSHRIFTARDAVVTRNDTTSISFRLNSSFVNRFSAIFNKRYSDNSDFLNNFFKGLYITSKFGSATMLNVNQIDMVYYFHYTYQTKTVDGLNDSTATVNTYVKFPANQEVRQVNRFVHPDKETVRTKLQQTDSLNYLSSPAGIYTRVNLPLQRMKARMDVSGRSLVVNSALLHVDLAEVDTSDYAQTMTKYVLLMREDSLKTFFKKRKLPSDTTAVLGVLSRIKNEQNTGYDYYYSFDLAGIMAYEYQKALKNNEEPPKELSMIMVPVIVGYSSSSTSTISSVSQRNLMSAVTICSGRKKVKPMKINMVYSGF